MVVVVLLPLLVRSARRSWHERHIDDGEAAVVESNCASWRRRLRRVSIATVTTATLAMWCCLVL